MDGDWRALAHADALVALRRPAEAETMYRGVLATDPESVRALLGLGRALHALGRDDEAERVVRSAVALDPDEPGGYHLLVDILCDTENGRAALAAAVRALALDPHSVLSHHQYARALLLAERPRAALTAAQRAVQAGAYDPDAHNILGICLDAVGEHGEARRAYATALSIDPVHMYAQSNLATNEMARGRLGRAGRLLLSAVGQAPQERFLHRNVDALLWAAAIWGGLVLVGAAVVLGLVVTQGGGASTRAGIGVTVLVGLGLAAVITVRRLPGPLLHPRRVWQLGGWVALGVALGEILLVGAIGILAFAPTDVAAVVARPTGVVLRGMAIVGLLMLFQAKSGGRE